jgi:Integrase core domain
LESFRALIPPHRPDLNAYVERFHRSLGHECLDVHRPATLAEVREVTETYRPHYHDQRPNQARSCGNHPPRVACPTFPTLPAVPQMVDPDGWLLAVDQRAFARTISISGHLTINHQDSSISRKLAGQRVTGFQSMPPRSTSTSGSRAGRSSRCPSKGCMERSCPQSEYVTLMKGQARSEYRRYLHTHKRLIQGRLWA